MTPFKQTQKQRVKAILLEKGRIDNFFAIETRLSLRLGAIIHTLRREGMIITTNRLKNGNTIYELIDMQMEAINA